jgi:predicted secreted Zn-dependent protease
VLNCPARRAAGSYHALTAYQLNWAYTPVATNGVCHLENVRVGLHVNQFMPMFSPGSTTPASVASTWDAYSQALKTHEDGHTALDIEYATRLATALQNTGNMDCATLTRQTQSIIDSHVTMLNTANELYDSQTNHGATQGAVL